MVYKPPGKSIFTDRSKAVLILLVIFVIYVSCLSCFLNISCSLHPFGHLLGKGWPLGSLVCDFYCVFVTFRVMSWVRFGA